MAKVTDRLGIRGTFNRTLACPQPVDDGRRGKTRLGAVPRQQFRLVLVKLGELTLQGLGDSGMKRTSRLAQQRAISRVLHQRMLEQIACMRRHALPEQQTSRNEAI